MVFYFLMKSLWSRFHQNEPTKIYRVLGLGIHFLDEEKREGYYFFSTMKKEPTILSPLFKGIKKRRSKILDQDADTYKYGLFEAGPNQNLSVDAISRAHPSKYPKILQ